MLLFKTIFSLALLGASIQEVSTEAQPPQKPKRQVEANYAVQLPSGELVVSCRPARDCPPIAASAQLVDPETGKALAMFADKDVGMAFARVDPTGKHLAFNSKEGLRIWPLGAGLDGDNSAVRKRRMETEVKLDLPPRKDWGMRTFQWTHDGQHLVTWADQFFHNTQMGRVRIWKRTGELVWTGPMVAQAHVHPTRNWICAVWTDNVLMGWPLKERNPTNKEGIRTLDLPGAMDTIQFSPDGETIAVGGTGLLEEGEGPTWSGHRDFPWLWLLDSTSGEPQQTKGIYGIDSFEFRTYLLDVQWSPDGTMIGVSLGKGHAVGAISSKDGSVVWSGGFHGGRMHETFNTAWTDKSWLLSGWGATRLVDPRNPDSFTPIDRVAHSSLLNLPGTDDIVVLYGWKIARLNPRTGEVRWSL